MIYLRAGLALLGALLSVFSSTKIVWEFVKWGVCTISNQSPPFIAGDSRIRYRSEAVALAVGLTLIFVAAILK